jgi:hypothetical protein
VPVSAALVVHIAVGAAAIAGITVVASSADNMKVAGGFALRTLAIPVLTELPHIARHVIESQFIGLQLCNGFFFPVGSVG